jgi:hypothetical protein
MTGDNVIILFIHSFVIYHNRILQKKIVYTLNLDSES